MSARLESRGQAASRLGIWAAGAVLALAAASGTAFAGLKSTANVSINTTNKTASGSMGSARANAADAGQYIGCWSAFTSSTGVASGGCKAKQGTTAVSCTFPAGDPFSFTVGLQMLNPDSHVKFTWNASNVCTSLKVSNYSYNKPKVL